jgi:YgiT-type zinc finger domain-containing protein
MSYKDTPHHIDCDNCGHLTESRIIRDTVRIRRQMVTIERMPVEVCPNCGERYYDGPFILELEKTLAEKSAA